MNQAHSSILGLDVGSKRIGIAAASLTVRLPRPLTTLEWDDNFYAELQKLIRDEDVGELVIGLPRGLDGQQTSQTDAIEAFVAELKQITSLPIHMQDEALTSKHAEEELKARGKTYKREDIDALAATFILQDYLNELPEADK